MTTKRSGFFWFVLKTVLGVFCLIVAAVLALNVWSWWELKQARQAFDAQITIDKPLSATRAPHHDLLVATQVAKDIQWTDEERATVGSASSLACRDWTPEQFKTVQLVVERNTDVQHAVLNALREGPRSQEGSEATQRSIGPVIYLVRLLTADARLALSDGNQERFIEIFRVFNLLELEMEADPGLTGHILNTLVRNLSNQTLLDGLSQENSASFDTAFLSQIQAALPATPLNEALRAAFIGDYIITAKPLEEACHSTPDGGIIKTLIHPIVTPILCRLIEGARIDVTLSCLDLIDRPFGLQPDAFEQPPRPSLWKIHRAVAEIGRPNALNTVARTQATAAQRQLLDAALTMRTKPWPGGANPGKRPDVPALNHPDPFSGQLLEYQLLDDGRLRLAVANGPELLNAIIKSGRQNWLDPVILGAPTPE